MNILIRVFFFPKVVYINIVKCFSLILNYFTNMKFSCGKFHLVEKGEDVVFRLKGEIMLGVSFVCKSLF